MGDGCANLTNSMLRNEQITSLCEQLSKAGKEEEAIQIAAQLKAALHEHLETVRGNLLVSIAQEIADETLQTRDLPKP
jgi:hypothetical protein